MSNFVITFDYRGTKEETWAAERFIRIELLPDGATAPRSAVSELHGRCRVAMEIHGLNSSSAERLARRIKDLEAVSTASARRVRT